MRHEKGNVFDTFEDWLGQLSNGVPNGSALAQDDLRLARDIWAHGFEAGHHEGHVDGWRLATGGGQPIETAPKDGTVVLGWDGAWITMAYNGKHWRLNDTVWADESDVADPSFWIPLPPPPTTRQS